MPPKKKKQTTSSGGTRLLPPPGSVIVRMYRIGHGDCFLLAFPGKTKTKPVYLLIDCGYKPGSPAFILPAVKTRTKDICRDILEATGGRVDVAILTHEHQDHVNNITKASFTGFSIGETWLSWTEDADDDLANDLRRKFRDKLIGLLAARNRLAAAGEDHQVARLDEFLASECGGSDAGFDAAVATRMLGAAGDGVSSNKASMSLFKALATKGVRCLRPHESILTLPQAKDFRIYVLGPPRDEEQLKDLDPHGSEAFHKLSLASAGNYFAAAACASEGGEPPFAGRYCVPIRDAFEDPEHGAFFSGVYGSDRSADSPSPGTHEAPGNPSWRRIDNDWLYSAEQLALAMGDYTNNTSLVVAIELRKGGRVLLFAADAQRGNWASWGRKAWQDGDKTVTAKDLLARTVLYKVGHHGSHNATLDGKASDETPNLGWMAIGNHAREFTAMIPAVREWAVSKAGWDHPLQSIKDALLKKANGRVFQTDTEFSAMKKTEGSSLADWDHFKSRVTAKPLYFDYRIPIE